MRIGFSRHSLQRPEGSTKHSVTTMERNTLLTARVPWAPLQEVLYSVCDQAGGLVGQPSALHLIMNQPTRQSVTAMPVYGSSLGSLSWDGSEDPSRRAANYLLRSTKPATRQQHNTSDDCPRKANRLPGFWRHFLPQISRQSSKALVE